MWVVGAIICLHGFLHQNDAVTLNWSKSYSLKAILRIPSAELSIPYQMWVNGRNNRSRIDFYGGLNKMYRQWNELNKTYEYFKIKPDTSGKTDKEVCNKIPLETAGAVMDIINGHFLIKQWTYVGQEVLHSIKTQRYTYNNIFYKYTVWVELLKNESNTDTIVPVRFVFERKVGNMSREYYHHDYLSFDDGEPNVQTLLMPLCMQCNPLPDATLLEPIDILSKHSPSVNSGLTTEDWYKRYNCETINNQPKKTITKQKGATIQNFQLEQEKTLQHQSFLKSFYATEGTFRWSKSYTLKAVLTVPAANITEPYQVWLDGDTGKSKVDFYHGMDKLYREYDTKDEKYKYYKIYPVSNNHMESKEVCNEVDAKASEIKMYAINSYLPVKSWTYVGKEFLNNAEAKKFVYEYPVKVNEKEVGKIVYSVWVNFIQGAAVPVRFVYEVKSEIKVLDSFRHDYTYFDSSKPDATILEKPLAMDCKPLVVESLHEPIDPLMEFIEPELGHSRVEKIFDWFKTKHSKIYTNEEEHFKRMNIFKDNLRSINSFNRQHRSFTLGVNHLADLSKEELKALYGTLKKDTTDNFDIEGSGDYDEDTDIGDEENDINSLTGVNANFNWRDYGAVSPVKDQTTICSSCYAFTTAAAVESSAYVARGCQNLDEVSEQAIIDCTWGTGSNGNIGCSGGSYEYALKWALKHGLPLKSEYGPYLAIEGRCLMKDMTKLVKIETYHKLDKQKRVIKDTLRLNGPLLAAIDADHFSFTFYNGGIYDDPECSSDPNNRSHGVVIVGYGRKNGEDHWILKNSFGQDWGEDGYMRLAQARNRCGLKNDVYTVNFPKNKSFDCKPLN